MRYAHTNLIAKNWKTLSAFYQRVFGCKPAGPQRDLSGQWIEEMTGIPGVRIQGEHLALPGYNGGGPTLEIFSYAVPEDREQAVNACGFSHIAFEVADVEGALEKLLREGGSLLGKTVSRDYGSMGVGTFVYAKDPEGNIIELQSWRR